MEESDEEEIQKTEKNVETKHSIMTNKVEKEEHYEYLKEEEDEKVGLQKNIYEKI